MSQRRERQLSADPNLFDVSTEVFEKAFRERALGKFAPKLELPSSPHRANELYRAQGASVALPTGFLVRKTRNVAAASRQPSGQTKWWPLSAAVKIKKQ